MSGRAMTSVPEVSEASSAPMLVTREHDPAIVVARLAGDRVAGAFAGRSCVGLRARRLSRCARVAADASGARRARDPVRIRASRASASAIIDAEARRLVSVRSATWRSARSSASSEEDAAFGGVGRLAEPLAVPCAGRLVLEQLADLGQREAGVVAQAPDELEPVEVRRVVEAVVAVGAGGRSRAGRPLRSSGSSGSSGRSRRRPR